VTQPTIHTKKRINTIPSKAELLAERERTSKAMMNLVALVKRLLERISRFNFVAAQDYAREVELELRKITRGR